MTPADVVWEYRQMQALDRARDGKPEDQPEVYKDPGFDEELASLGINQDMLNQQRNQQC